MSRRCRHRAAGTASSTITVNFTSAPIWKIRWKNTGTAAVTELSRSPGYVGSNGNVQLTVKNPNYPNASATYAITVYGRYLTTAAAGYRFSEET